VLADHAEGVTEVLCHRRGRRGLGAVCSVEMGWVGQY
jgi:hypothetical protein